MGCEQSSVDEYHHHRRQRSREIKEKSNEKFVYADIREEYEILEKIGDGAFATVLKCRDRRSNNYFACKKIDKNRMRALFRKNVEKIEHRIASELAVSRRLCHENIVKIFDSYQESRYHFLVMELMNGGELFEFLMQRGRLIEHEAVGVISQVCSAIRFMHKKGIVHRDLKPENVMLKYKEDLSHVKLIDFGMSKLFGPGENMTRSRLGTPGYIAPEVIKGNGYDVAIDMWSLGVLTYILLCGYMPFDESGGKSTDYETDFPEEEWSVISPDGKDFVQALIVKDVSSRITAEECFDHSWLKSDSKSKKALLPSPRNLNSRKRRSENKRWAVKEGDKI